MEDAILRLTNTINQDIYSVTLLQAGTAQVVETWAVPALLTVWCLPHLFHPRNPLSVPYVKTAFFSRKCSRFYHTFSPIPAPRSASPWPAVSSPASPCPADRSAPIPGCACRRRSPFTHFPAAAAKTPSRATVWGALG